MGYLFVMSGKSPPPSFIFHPQDSLAILRIVLALFHALAYQAGASGLAVFQRVRKGVLGRAKMSVLAIRLSPRFRAALAVLSMRNRLQVCRVDTCAIAAYVVKCQTFRDRAYREFVGEPVREAILLFTPKGQVEPAIAIGVERPNPLPTFLRFLDVRPEPLDRIDPSNVVLMPPNEHKRLALHLTKAGVCVSGNIGLASAAAMAVSIWNFWGRILMHAMLLTLCAMPRDVSRIAGAFATMNYSMSKGASL